MRPEMRVEAAVGPAARTARLVVAEVCNHRLAEVAAAGVFARPPVVAVEEVAFGHRAAGAHPGAALGRAAAQAPVGQAVARAPVGQAARKGSVDPADQGLGSLVFSFNADSR